MNKKAQEEMVGFALIVVIVVVIAVIILAISLRDSGGRSRESQEIDSLLSSIYDFTTECQISSGYPLAIKDLVIRCDERKECDGGEDTCDVLRDSLEGIMENSAYVVSTESGLYYYELSVYKDVEGNNIDVFEPITKKANDEIEIGRCPGWIMYNDRVFYSSNEGSLYLEIRLCRRN